MRDPSDEDRRLAAEAGEGSDAAFAELVERHRGHLVRAVAARSGRPVLAEDAVQEALLAAHCALREGRRPANVRGWLSTIAWRRTIDLVRRERDTATLSEADGAPVHEGPEARVARADELALVLGQWQRLPARQRHALALSVLEGRSLEEIAAAMDLTAEGAKALVARSRRVLAARVLAVQEPCDAVVPRIVDAVERGARLPADVRWHADACGACAGTHRQARRRRRRAAILLVPVGLAERLRDAAAILGTGHDASVPMMAKVCAGVCAATVAGGGSVAVVVTHEPGRIGQVASAPAPEGPPQDRILVTELAEGPSGDRGRPVAPPGGGAAASPPPAGTRLVRPARDARRVVVRPAARASTPVSTAAVAPAAGVAG